MGNCMKKEASMEWGGEDWGSLTSEEDDPHKLTNWKKEEEEKGLLINMGRRTSSSSFAKTTGGRSNSSTITEVKIKITKKQLEELLGKTDVQGVSVQQVLEQLIKVSDGYESHQLSSWRPALQSIPETY